MKKIATLFFVLLGVNSFAQTTVTITYQVDITEYLNGGGSLDPTGIRIGGDFATMNTSLPDWTPTDAACAMSDMGGNIWSIAVDYPMSEIGNTQSYKFVNGDWGPIGDNEGTDPGTTIAIDGCGADDGGGNINRQFVIPQANMTISFCWDSCYNCDGSDPSINPLSLEDQLLSKMTVSPNPTNDFLNFNFGEDLNMNFVVSIYDLSGKLIKQSETMSALLEMNVNELESGSYLYTVRAASGSSSSGKFIKL